MSLCAHFSRTFYDKRNENPHRRSNVAVNFTESVNSCFAVKRLLSLANVAVKEEEKSSSQRGVGLKHSHRLIRSLIMLWRGGNRVDFTMKSFEREKFVSKAPNSPHCKRLQLHCSLFLFLLIEKRKLVHSCGQESVRRQEPEFMIVCYPPKAGYLHLT